MVEPIVLTLRVKTFDSMTSAIASNNSTSPREIIGVGGKIQLPFLG